MDLSTQQRFEILKLEMELIQGVFNKYDTMIFQSRNLFVTMWIATLGLAFTIRSPILILMAGILAILYWVLEGLMRHQYWYKYVTRYRALRNAFNENSTQLDAMALYDLTNHYGKSKPSRCEQLGASFGKLEPAVLYLVLGAAAVLLWHLVEVGTIELPPSTNGSD